MNNWVKIRKITVFYNYLQGLKMVPVGILWIFLALRNGNVFGYSRDLVLPLLILILLTVGFVLISQYYERKFGKVRMTAKNKFYDFLFMGISLALLYLAMVLDPVVENLYGLQLSLQGITWAIFFSIVAIILARYYYFVFGLLLLATSILPSAGIVSKDMLFGWSDGVIGIALVGLAFLFGGIFDHLYLVKNLPMVSENNYG